MMNRNMKLRDKNIAEINGTGSYNTEIFMKYLEMKGDLNNYSPIVDFDGATEETTKS